MAKPLSLTLFYTGNIRGDLALLPRLYSFLRQLQGQDRRTSLLLDLGASCVDDVWHCHTTGGRSTLIVLDGMGYQAANVEGILGCEVRDLLARQVTLGLVDRARDWVWRAPAQSEPGIRATIKPSPGPSRLQIRLKPAAGTRMDGRVLSLQAVPAGQIGEVRVELAEEARIASSARHDLPPGTPPNATIAGTVEFVEAEARLLGRKGQTSPPLSHQGGA